MSETAKLELGEPTEHMREFRAALADGRLTLPRCRACGHAWLPPRDQCPRCLAADWEWETASGDAKVVSWVVYHRAFHDAFADRVPYNVTVAELAEGPRVITNVVGVEGGDGLTIDAPLTFVADTEGDVPVARFRLS